VTAPPFSRELLNRHQRGPGDIETTLAIYTHFSKMRPPTDLRTSGRSGASLSRDDWIRTSDHLHPKQPKVVPNGSQTSPILMDLLVPDSAQHVQGSHDLSRFSRNFATNLLPPIEQLLTVSQVARLFGVCTATVYSWAATGALPHIRIVNVIRVRFDEIAHALEEHYRRIRW